LQPKQHADSDYQAMPFKAGLLNCLYGAGNFGEVKYNINNKE
jgi:hypothetical protein